MGLPEFDQEYRKACWDKFSELIAKFQFVCPFAVTILQKVMRDSKVATTRARAANALRFVLIRHPGDTIVLVGHDSVNRALLMQLIDQPLSAYWRIAQSPCCLNEIDVAGGKISVQRINETGYLEALAR